MSYAAAPKTTKINLPSDADYWVEVKVGLRYGELKRFYEYGGTDGPFTTVEKLKLCILSWNLDDTNGKVLPISDESIDLLQEDDVVAIAEAATAQKVSPDEKKN